MSFRINIKPPFNTFAILIKKEPTIYPCRQTQLFSHIKACLIVLMNTTPSLKKLARLQRELKKFEQAI